MAGLTQDEVVAKADISSVTLSKLETGVNRPNFEIMIALAYALDASPNFLAGWDAQPNPSQPSDRRRLLIRLNAVANQLPDEWIDMLISIAEKAASQQNL